MRTKSNQAGWSYKTDATDTHVPFPEPDVVPDDGCDEN